MARNSWLLAYGALILSFIACSLCLNIPCDTEVTVRMEKTGMGSTIRLMLGRALWAYSQNRNIVIIDDKYWTYSCSDAGWTCYFTPPTTCRPVSSDKEGLSWYKAWGSVESAEARSRVQEFLRIPGPTLSLVELSRIVLAKLWAINEETSSLIHNAIEHLPLDKPFLAVHIRRGDKLREMKDMTYQDTPQMVELIKSEARALGVRYEWVFVMTDDHRVVADVKAAAPDWKVMSLISEDKIGFNVCAVPSRQNLGKCKCTGKEGEDPTLCFQNPHDIENRKKIETLDPFKEGLSIITDLFIAGKAELFYGDCSSNVGHLVQLLRKQPVNTGRCYDKANHFFDGATLLKRGVKDHPLQQLAPPKTRGVLVFVVGMIGAGHSFWQSVFSSLAKGKVFGSDDLTTHVWRWFEEIYHRNEKQANSERTAVVNAIEAAWEVSPSPILINVLFPGPKSDPVGMMAYPNYNPLMEGKREAIPQIPKLVELAKQLGVDLKLIFHEADPANCVANIALRRVKEQVSLRSAPFGLWQSELETWSAVAETQMLVMEEQIESALTFDHVTLEKFVPERLTESLEEQAAALAKVVPSLTQDEAIRTLSGALKVHSLKPCGYWRKLLKKNGVPTNLLEPLTKASRERKLYEEISDCLYGGQ